MLEKMPTPCRTTINEEFESPNSSSDFRHMILSFMNKCEDMAIRCVNKANVLFSTGNVYLFHPHLNSLFSRACKTMFGSSSSAHILPSWAKQVAQMSLDSWSPILIVPATSLKQVSKNTWMLRHCASHPRRQLRTKWPF